MKRVAIIGGGASGLFSALHAAIEKEKSNTDISITIFESQEKVAKKLLITGSSQCNITNSAPLDEMKKHYYEKEKEIESILTTHSVEKTLQFFNHIGLSHTIRDDKKVFPSSFKSIDVIKSLQRQAQAHNILIIYNTRIDEVKHTNNLFSLYSNNTLINTFDAVILATGGFTFPRTGSKGDGYRLAQQVGHSIVTPRFALTGVQVNDVAIHSLSGLTIEKCAIEIEHGNWKKGSLLFTHEGLSGPVIINNSRYLSSNSTMKVCYLVDKRGEGRKGKEVQKEIASLCQRMGKSMFKTVLATYPLPHSLLEYLLNKNNIDGKKKASEVGKRDLIAISSSLTKDEFIITIDNMESKAMVTCGGVSLDEIDLMTMESTIIPHLYFCGEIIDIDGETGGYNLQLAWSTGAISGKEAIKKLH